MSCFPAVILRRVAKRFQDLKSCGQAKGKWRCYLEHEDERETDGCAGQHMRRDEGRELAVFE